MDGGWASVYKVFIASITTYNPQILEIKGLSVWRLEIAGKNISATSHSPQNSLALGKQVIN